MDPTNGIGRIGTVQWSFAKQKKTTSWASPSVAKKRTLKLPVPSHTVNLSMETCNIWKLRRSWMLLDGPGIPISVLNSQSCLPKETCSDHGRWLRNCVWMDPAKSKHCHWNQVYVFRGSTEGVRVQTLNGLIDFLRPFFHGQNALFSHLHSLLCVLCVLRVLPCILYLRVLSRCHPATPPCSSAVREQPGQVWNGRRMRNLMASRQVSSLPTSRWECWGVSPE